MSYLGWVLIISSLSFSAFAGDLLTEFCDRAGGEVVNGLSCSKRKIRWKSKYCVLKDASDRKMFFNGCSGPSGGHAGLFYPACIKHDLCYHHEPASSGLSKSECDKNFRSDLLELCKDAKNQKYCKTWAKIMYEGVRVGGAKAYSCYNDKAAYQEVFI
jgi:hypothetical protein